MNANALYQKFNDYLASLSLREKVLLLFVGIAAIYAIWDLVFFAAYTKQQKATSSQIEKIKSEEAELNTQIAEIIAKLAEQGNPNALLKQNITDTQAELVTIENKLSDTFESLVPPKEVTNFIRSLLLENSNLELIHLKNEPVQVIDLSEDKPSKPQQAENNQKSARLFEHATDIKLIGDYLSLHKYLTQLEQSKWGLYWDQLEYKVTAYPNAEISLRVYTLSTDEHWLGL